MSFDDNNWQQELELQADNALRSVESEDKQLADERLKRDLAAVQRTGSSLDLSVLYDEQFIKVIDDYAKSIPIATEGLALLILPVAASILGRNHQFHVFDRYYEKPILQMVLQVVAGMRKSLTLDQVTKYLDKMDYEEDMAYAKKKMEWDATPSKERTGPEPRLPRERVISTGTSEALVEDLENAKDHPGLLRKVDEFPRLIDELDGYKAGNSKAGISQELIIWDGSTIRSGRVGKKRKVYNPRLSTVSTVQPSKLLKCINQLGGLDDSDSGLWGRWLIIRPPTKLERPKRDGLGAEKADRFQAELEQVYRGLEGLPPTTWEPTPEAEELLRDLDDRVVAEASNAPNSFLENYSMKSLAHVGRIAGILAAIREARDRTLFYQPGEKIELCNRIGVKEVEAAIVVMNYFMEQAKSLASEQKLHQTDGDNNSESAEVLALGSWAAKKTSGYVITGRTVVQAQIKALKGAKISEVRQLIERLGQLQPDKFQLRTDSKGQSELLVI